MLFEVALEFSFLGNRTTLVCIVEVELNYDLFLNGLLEVITKFKSIFIIQTDYDPNFLYFERYKQEIWDWHHHIIKFRINEPPAATEDNTPIFVGSHLE